MTDLVFVKITSTTICHREVDPENTPEELIPDNRLQEYMFVQPVHEVFVGKQAYVTIGGIINGLFVPAKYGVHNPNYAVLQSTIAATSEAE